MATVTAAWARIEDWLARHAPASATVLAPPADPAEIAAAEVALGLTVDGELWWNPAGMLDLNGEPLRPAPAG
jgi:cell wall assembly regulator SMI1